MEFATLDDVVEFYGINNLRVYFRRDEQNGLYMVRDRPTLFKIVKYNQHHKFYLKSTTTWDLAEFMKWDWQESFYISDFESLMRKIPSDYRIYACIGDDCELQRVYLKQRKYG